MTKGESIEEYTMSVGTKHIKSARYWNTDGMQISIVAVITEGIDWAAYIGATKDAYRREETVEWTVKYGGKLSRSDALHFFPDIELPYRN